MSNFFHGELCVPSMCQDRDRHKLSWLRLKERDKALQDDPVLSYTPPRLCYMEYSAVLNRCQESKNLSGYRIKGWSKPLSKKSLMMTLVTPVAERSSLRGEANKRASSGKPAPADPLAA